MGSFYSTCSISDLTIIDGDKMYIQLILPSWVKNPYSIDGEKYGCGEKGLRVSNEGSLAEFVPFGFPIEGKYNDCGDITDIIPSRNIEMLEDFFGISIKDIIECASDDRWYKYGYLERDKRKERNDWIVGDNKMKNMDILKDLTITYFKKEHYDFLAEKWIGSDSYFEGVVKERTTKYLNILKKLDQHRPKNEVRKIFTVDDITDKIREKYSIIKDNGSNDKEFEQMIVNMQNHKSGDWWKSDWNYELYIPTISNYNMFKLLPIGSEDIDDVRKQYTFIMNMYNLTKVLRPSHYGSQENNFQAYVDFHKMSVEMVGNTVLEMKKDIILDEISWILKDSLKGISNEEVIKNNIIEGLSEYGYNIKL